MRQHSRTYLRVLRSSRWRQLRLEAISARGGRCERCGGAHRLQLHHK